MKTETSEFPYTHPEHTEKWDIYNVAAMEVARIEEEEAQQRQEDEIKRQEQIEALKLKVGLVFEAAGYCLDANELRLLFGQEPEDCK